MHVSNIGWPLASVECVLLNVNSQHDNDSKHSSTLVWNLFEICLRTHTCIYLLIYYSSYFISVLPLVVRMQTEKGS